MKVTKRIHSVYKEWEQAKAKGIEIRQLMGKYQYLYKTEKGEISLIQLISYWKEGEDLWEIYEISNNDLFDDVKRFPTKAKAVEKINDLLNSNEENKMEEKQTEIEKPVETSEEDKEETTEEKPEEKE